MNNSESGPSMTRGAAILGLFSLLFLLPLLTSCGKQPYIRDCSRTGEVCVEAGVVISFSTTDSTYVDANTLVVTREVDPNLIDYNGGNASGKVTITLTDGTKKSLNSGLTYSASESASISPATAGFVTYAFVPSDPAALQSFIDQYHNQTTEIDVFTTVNLRDLSGSADTTTVEAQEEHNSESGYIGSVGVSVGDINEEFKY